MKKDVLSQIHEIGFLPLVALEDADKAVPLAEALAKGGMPVIEVTYRTECAGECIRRIAAGVPEMLVGAGTVHTAKQAEEAVDAGAMFIVTPGYSEEVVSFCISRDVPVIPGISNASGLELAMKAGLKTVKFFPAEISGGYGAVKALSEPYKDVRFLPTGGISSENMLNYLSLRNVLAVGGSFLCPSALIEQSDWDGIARNCRDVIYRNFGFSVGHVGINASSEEEARSIANQLCFLFGQKYTEFPGACFAGCVAEVVKPSANGQRGRNGHIAINSRDIDRAAAYFRRIGIAFDEESAGYNAAGQMTVIYFKDDIGGFAIHLRRE